MRRLRNLLTILISTLLMSSCATMLSDATHVVNIQSDLSDSKVKVNDSVYSLPANVVVKRSNKDLHLTLISDSKEIPFKAKPKLTGTFKYANLAGVYVYFTTYLVDLTNNKRFYYGKSLWLDSNSKDSTATVLKKEDSRYKYTESLSQNKQDAYKTALKEKDSSSKSAKSLSQINHYIYKKGDFRINVSIPFLNLYRLDPGNYRINNTVDFIGFSLGTEYFHHKDQFLNATYSRIESDPITTFFATIMTWTYQEVTSDYFTLTNNHVSDRFSIGYGLSYGQTHFIRSSLFISSYDLDKTYSVFGLSFPFCYQAGRNLHLGIVYNPSFFRINQGNQWEYEHLFSLNLTWKIKLKSNN